MPTPLRGQVRRAAGCARAAGVLRIQPAAARRRRPRAGLSIDLARATRGDLRARHAHLQGSEQPQSSDDDRRLVGDLRSGATEMAEGRLLAVARPGRLLPRTCPLGWSFATAPTDFEAVANGDPGAPLGRELELADLLRHLKSQLVRNVVWITADVHYCAAHHYDPVRARFTEFDPFWEFVAGPLNAGTFGPNPSTRRSGRKSGSSEFLPG